MLLKIIIDSGEGDKVRINLPVAVIKVFVNSETNTVISGNKALEEIDFKQLIALIEQGIIGELVSIDSADGVHVTIVVE